MVLFPNCKINIGLQITGKRSDGFHELETIFYPVAIRDALEIIDGKEGQQEQVIYTSSGDAIEGKQADNLCLKAYSLIKIDYPALPKIQLHLHKAIPSGAGLGGGSADAAFTIQLLDKLYGLNIPVRKIHDYALQLGSDCPFFLKNKPAFASGRGEILEDISVDLSAYQLMVINPGIHVNTGWAFSQLQLNDLQHTDLRKVAQQPIGTWKENIRNDFESPVFNAHPEIAGIKTTLYEKGALYAAMSGSGSSVFGIFSKTDTPELNFPAHYFCKLV